MSKLIFLIGYSCSGKTTALTWVQEVFSRKCFCFDVGEVVRDWASVHGWSDTLWPRLSLVKDKSEGFDWIFRHANTVSKKHGFDSERSVIISGNRIRNFKASFGMVNFIDEASRFFAKQKVSIVYIRASVMTRYLRNTLRDPSRRLSRNEFLKRDRFDRRLGLRKLISNKDFVIDNESSIERFQDDALRIIGDAIHE